MVRNSSVISALFIGTCFFPAVANAQNTAWLDSVASGVVSIFSLLVIMLSAAALMVFVWGLSVFIARSGDEKAHTEGKRRMVWGIVALFVLVSVWGLVALLRSMFGFGAKDPGLRAPRTTLSTPKQQESV